MNELKPRRAKHTAVGYFTSVPIAIGRRTPYHWSLGLMMIASRADVKRANGQEEMARGRKPNEVT